MAADDRQEKSLFVRIKNCGNSSRIFANQQFFESLDALECGSPARALSNNKTILRQVLAELNRKKDDLPRSPCPSRSEWGWLVGRESIDSESHKAEQRKEDKLAAEKEVGVEGLRRSHGSSDESGTEGAEEKCSKLESGQSENRSAMTTQESEEGRATDRNLPRTDKFKPRRYYIKMQNPEALPCCDSSADCKICPKETRGPKSFDEDNENYRENSSCRCSRSADYHQWNESRRSSHQN